LQKCLSDGATLQQNLTTQLSSLDRAKRNYEKAYRDSEKAVDSYKRADMDLNLSRAEVERYKNVMTSKIQQSDDAKNEYANQLQKTNNLQQQHYSMLLPSVLNRLQELDEKRTRGFREFIVGAADVESSVAPIIARCMEGIVKAGESINEKEDTFKVIERLETFFEEYINLKLTLYVRLADINLVSRHQGTYPSRICPSAIRIPCRTHTTATRHRTT